MADVHWIKLSTGLFGNRKIAHIRSMKQGSDLFVLWIGLLVLAGQVNDGGLIYLAPAVPYTAKSLASSLGLKRETVEEGLRLFSGLGMINVSEDGAIGIAGWADHQSVDELEKLRQSSRERSKAYRDRKRESDVTRHVTEDVTVTPRHGTDKIREEEIRTDENKGESTGRAKRGAFVPPAPEEIERYASEEGLKIDARRFYDHYEATGWMMGNSRMADWHAAARKWAAEDTYRRPSSPVPGAGKKPKPASFDAEEFFQAAVDKSYGKHVDLGSGAG